MVLNPGDPVPDLEAVDQEGRSRQLPGNRPAVLYFYPEDGTPGCKTEADQFQAERPTYQVAGVEVYGISTDDVESHRSFAEDRGLEFPLLADSSGELGEALGIPRENDRYRRTTVVINEGRIHRVYENVTPDGHAREVLMDLLEEGLVSLEEQGGGNS